MVALVCNEAGGTPEVATDDVVEACDVAEVPLSLSEAREPLLCVGAALAFGVFCTGWDGDIIARPTLSSTSALGTNWTGNLSASVSNLARI